MQIRETPPGQPSEVDPRREIAAGEIANYLRLHGGFELSIGNTAGVASSIIGLLESHGMSFPDADPSE